MYLYQGDLLFTNKNFGKYNLFWLRNRLKVGMIKYFNSCTLVVLPVNTYDKYRLHIVCFYLLKATNSIIWQGILAEKYF